MKRTKFEDPESTYITIPRPTFTHEELIEEDRMEGRESYYLDLKPLLEKWKAERVKK